MLVPGCWIKKNKTQGIQHPGTSIQHRSASGTGGFFPSTRRFEAELRWKNPFGKSREIIYHPLSLLSIQIHQDSRKRRERIELHALVPIGPHRSRLHIHKRYVGQTFFQSFDRL
jgi:hypothetical protein